MRTYVLLPLLSALLAAPAPAALAAAQPAPLRYTLFLSGKTAGTETVEHKPDGSWRRTSSSTTAAVARMRSCAGRSGRAGYRWRSRSPATTT